MSFLGRLGYVLGSLKPVEVSLVIMNLVLVAEVWHELDLASATRSVHIARIVMADIAADQALALCVIEEQMRHRS